MFDSDIWQEIWITIKRNKWRSFMTGFGVFWGILMLIVLMSLGNGITNAAMSTISSVPINSVFLFTSNTSMPYKGFQKGRYWNMDLTDVDWVYLNYGNKISFVTVKNFGNTETVSYGDKSGSYSTSGVSPTYFLNEPQKMVYGRAFNEIDMKERRKVCVIGDRIYRALFHDGEDPTGKMVRVGSVYYTVVGVAKPMSQVNIGSRCNETVQIPITTLQQVLNSGNDIGCMIVSLDNDADATPIQKSICRGLRERHKVNPDDEKALDGFNIAEQVKMFTNLFMGLNILLWVVGIGSLLAGLIGISNIMLITVRERTQEIGIRRALGAKPGVIMRQVMAEGLVMTLVAGVLGLVLGVWIMAGVSSTLPEPDYDNGEVSLYHPIITFTVAVAALAVLVLGGTLAGWWPAHRAMKIKAIEALREE